jgi:2'-hydroxyisoflavone reductase
VRLLLLGGAHFLGRAVIDSALAHGHEVTVFNRGRTNPDLYPELEKLVGERAGSLDALKGRTWDAVVDTSGYVPHLVRASAEALADSGRYCFVSSVSVYSDFSGPVSERSPLAPLGDDPVDELLPGFENYGALKALCEQAVRATFADRALIVRPGLIVGPHDPTGRFTYWPHRVARGGDVLAPGPPQRTVQFVDVRDLGGWIVALCELGIGGTFNAAHTGVAWSELLAACAEAAPNGQRPVWVTDDFLLQQGVGEWIELPLWLGDAASQGMHQADVSAAVAAGLRFRPLVDTVRATLERARPVEGVGLTAEREEALLAAWRGR